MEANHEVIGRVFNPSQPSSDKANNYFSYDQSNMCNILLTGSQHSTLT